MTQDLAIVANLPTEMVITIASRTGAGGAMVRIGPGAPASGASPFTANDMLGFAFRLTAPSTPIYKGFWLNGSAAGGNTAVAIYDAAFTKLVQTASTAGSGNSVPQSVAWSGGTIKLGPGLYYAVLAHDSATTNRFFRWSIATTGAAYWKALGCFRQASITVGSLPATATPVVCNNVAFPVFGLITRSGFDV
jgi:hypothetical protein